MSSNTDLAATLDLVISQLQAVRVSLDPNPRTPETGSLASFELVSSTEPEPLAAGLPQSLSSSGGRAVPWTAEWDYALQVASTPKELLAVDLSPLQVILDSSRILAAGEWTPLARLARGLAAGRSARRALSTGLYTQDSTVSLGLRNCFYICLYCPAHPRGFWAGSSKVYFQNIKGPGGERFHPESVSHSFASRAESVAFLLGAQAEWPPHLQ